MFYDFDTIKQIKNFEKYGVWYRRTYYVILKKKKYGTVLFGIKSSKIRENITKYRKF